MIDQSILRAQRDRDNSIQKQRRERLSRMMSKIYEAKITTRQSPFIHTMYQDYSQKFCKKFKARYMEQCRQSYQKAKEQGSLSNKFGKQSAILGNPQSSISNQTNFLDDLNQDNPKKITTSEIRPNQIKKIEFSSEIKKQKGKNQMMKKKAPQQAEVVSKLKEEPKKQSNVQYEQILPLDLKQIVRSQIKNESLQESKKQKNSKIKSESPAIIKQSSIKQMPLQNKSELIKPYIPIPISKQQQIKSEVKGEEQQYEEVEQDSPSYYSRKLKEIDDPVKQVTRSQILPSKQEFKDEHEGQNSKSQIRHHQIDKQSVLKDAKNDNHQQDLFQRQKADIQNPIQIDKKIQKHEQNKDSIEQVKRQELIKESLPNQQHEAIHPPSKDQNIPNNQNKDQQNAIFQQFHQQISAQISQPNRQQLQQSEFSLNTVLVLEQSKDERLEEVQEQMQSHHFSSELKTCQEGLYKNQQSIAHEQAVQSPQKLEIVSSDKKQNEKTLEIPSKDQPEKSSQLQLKTIVQTQQKPKKVQQQDEAQQLIDDIENQIDNLVGNFQSWLDKQLIPCKNCSKKEESQQQQSEKNSSDADQ